MKAEHIELGKFYRSTQADGVCTIFIFACEDHYYTQGNAPTMCEKWIYWDVAKKIINHFVYLDKTFIDGLALLENPIAQRNMKNGIKDGAEEDNEKLKSWLDLKDQMLEEFVHNTVLPEVFNRRKNKENGK